MKKRQNKLISKTLLTVSLTALSLTSVAQLPIKAEETPPRIVSALDITFDPPNESQPKVTRGGASRGSQCVVDATDGSQIFAPLLPLSRDGLTAVSHPTLLVHVPDTSAESVFLTLQDENEEEVYQTIMPIGVKSGVISLVIPEEAPGLEVGKNYKWSFALMCDNKLRPDSPIVQGYIKRVQPESKLTAKLENATPMEMAAFYGEAGIWYETISTLAELRQQQPQNQELESAWNNLLDSVGLTEVAKAELID